MKLHFARLLIMTPLLASVALLSPASAGVPQAGAARTCPSRLDYVVFASFADSSNMLAMSTYRTPSARSSP
jgi:hypothetical protein